MAYASGEYNDSLKKTYLHVQSWGTDYYIDYDDLCDYNNRNDRCNGYLVFCVDI